MVILFHSSKYNRNNKADDHNCIFSLLCSIELKAIFELFIIIHLIF